MPSPTSRTRPISRVSSRGRNSSISCVSTETISSGLNLITASLDELVPDFGQARAHGAVVEVVADLDDEAADQVGIDAGLQDRLAPEGTPQLLPQPLALVLRQWRGAADVGPDPPRPLVPQ